jgi:hypothetical protein
LLLDIGPRVSDDIDRTFSFYSTRLSYHQPRQTLLEFSAAPKAMDTSTEFSHDNSDADDNGLACLTESMSSSLETLTLPCSLVRDLSIYEGRLEASSSSSSSSRSSDNGEDDDVGIGTVGGREGFDETDLEDDCSINQYEPLVDEDGEDFGDFVSGDSKASTVPSEFCCPAASDESASSDDTCQPRTSIPPLTPGNNCGT